LFTSTPSRRSSFLEQVDRLDSIPSVNAIIQPLIGYLQQPLETLDMQRVIDLISHDNSLATQCLHLANSPLFGRWQSITTTRGAVIALGLQRMREIAVSCCVLKLLPAETKGLNPVVFWEHSLACALVCRRMAKRIGAKDPEQAYLAGLLHDVGFIVNLHVLGAEFYEVMLESSTRGCPIDVVEDEHFGFNHCEAGKVLARKWDLAADLVEVISHHHRMSALADYPALTAIVTVADRMCRSQGLGYGYQENLNVDWDHDEAVEILRATWPIARSVSWARFSAELDAYLKDVHNLVAVLYRLST
jgi:putative nucleotidyltransferase with HDIG domain